MDNLKACITIGPQLNQEGGDLIHRTNQKDMNALALLGTDEINRPLDNLSRGVIAADGIKGELNRFGQVLAFPRV